MMRQSIIAALCASFLLLTGCGGGSSSNQTANNGSGSSATTTNPPAATGTTGSTGSGGSSTVSPTTSDPNVVPITIDSGPTNNEVNVPFISVTVCAPNTGNCQVIDHVLVDTGSTGLRLFASELSPSLSLPADQTAAGSALGECAQFADGYTWGPVKRADIKIGGEVAANAAIHVIGDSTFPAVPSACSSTGKSINDVQHFGARGVLGVSIFAQDCDPNYCGFTVTNHYYYKCVGTSCTQTTVSSQHLIQNPVSLFASDNNGVVIQLPQVSANGATNPDGYLIFGIGTATNNTINSANLITLDPSSGYMTTVYKNHSYANSFFDSGSNGFFFPDSSFPQCYSGFFCPTSLQNLSATIRGTNNISTAVSFTVDNASTLFKSNSTAFNSLAGTNPDSESFDWGLSFFYGRTVFTAIEGQSTPRGAGPYVAF